jgi:hypothetical protein
LYSNVLASKDKFITHKWISKLYDELNDPRKAIFQLVEYVKGCSESKSATIWKEIGERYITFNEFEKAILSFQEAINNDPK